MIKNRWGFGRVESLGLAEGSRLVWRRASLATAGMVLWAGMAFWGTSAAHGQTMAKCPSPPHKLTLTQVMDRVKNNKTYQENRTVELIHACHVSFSLDAPSLEKLVQAGLTDAEFGALNPETAAGLTVDQARAEVVGLEAYVAQPDKTSTPQHDAEIARIEGSYQVERAQAAKTPVKDQYTSTAEYNAQVQRTQAAAAEVDRRHQAALAQANARYQAMAEAKNKPFRERIEYLKKGSYAAAVTASFVSYNADAQRLTATIGGEEYWFDNVAGATARQLNEGWKNTTVEQPYVEDAAKSRVLRLAAANIEVHGRSRAALQGAESAKGIQEGRERAERHDYAGAIASYQRVLAVDPDNSQAKAELTAVQTAANQEATAGEWVDTRTMLMWTTSDNGQNINWKGAMEYCQALRGGGSTDWRVPTVDELKGLYDLQSNRETPPLPTTQRYMHGGQYEVDQKGSTWPYHIKPQISLTGAAVWSSSRDNADDIMHWFFYATGNTDSVDTGFKRNMRALCVRRWLSSAGEKLAEEQKKTPSVAEQQRVEGVWADPQTNVLWTLKDSGQNLNWSKAQGYCRSLVLGGYLDWRLPSLDQIKDIYDAPKDSPPSDWKYHIKGEIKLTGAVIWSGTVADAGALGNGPEIFSFSNGLGIPSPASSGERVLCVRQNTSSK